MVDYIHIFICLITAVIYIIVSLLTGQDPEAALSWLILIIALSYIAGLWFRAYLKKNVFIEKDIDLTEDIALLEAEENAAAENAAAEEAAPEDEFEDLL